MVRIIGLWAVCYAACSIPKPLRVCVPSTTRGARPILQGAMPDGLGNHNRLEYVPSFTYPNEKSGEEAS